MWVHHKASACAIWLLAALSGVAQEAVDDPSWKEGATKHGFSPDDLRALERDRVLITSETYRQVFDPYVQSNIPPFVTSDSILNAFHVLLEESVAQAETSRARSFPAILQRLWKGVAAAEAAFIGDAELLAAARVRAQIVLGVALGLSGAEANPVDDRLGAMIRAEVEQVVKAQVVVKPDWLGPADPVLLAIDYARFQPRGLYDRSDLVRRYFRTLSWLQAIPFRVDRDKELVAILLLAKAMEKSTDERLSIADALEGLRGFLGAQDDADLVLASRLVERRDSIDIRPEGLADLRKQLRDWGGMTPGINDQLRFPPLGSIEPNFRVVSARRTPDAVLFQKTTDPRRIDRPLPSGLEVAASLGSSFAQSAVDAPEEIIKECRPLFADNSIYAEYLGCLAALVDAAEPDAPAFMTGRPWTIKSTQTVLSGWAQLRHTMMLQAKRSEFFGGLSSNPAGFVEPDPEFFARLNRLGNRVHRWLAEAGAFATDPREAADEIRALVAVLEKGGFALKGAEAENALEDPESRRTFSSGQWYLWAVETPGAMTWKAAFFGEAIQSLKAALPGLERGEVPLNSRMADVIRGRRSYLSPLWDRFNTLCLRLEALAHKQLRSVACTDAERQFLRQYGSELAAIMLYAGNSYLAPNDDAPRVADVHGAGARSLHVAIGRARAIYVLYPWKGKDILSRGAVMPYYEFAQEGRLTDADWKARLDAAAPPRPDWARPIETITRTGLKKD